MKPYNLPKLLDTADEVYNLIKDKKFKQAKLTCLDLAISLKEIEAFHT